MKFKIKKVVNKFLLLGLFIFEEKYFFHQPNLSGFLVFFTIFRNFCSENPFGSATSAGCLPQKVFF